MDHEPAIDPIIHSLAYLNIGESKLNTKHIETPQNKVKVKHQKTSKKLSNSLLDVPCTVKSHCKYT